MHRKRLTMAGVWVEKCSRLAVSRRRTTVSRSVGNYCCEQMLKEKRCIVSRLRWLELRLLIFGVRKSLRGVAEDAEPRRLTRLTPLQVSELRSISHRWTRIAHGRNFAVGRGRPQSCNSGWCAGRRSSPIDGDALTDMGDGCGGDCAWIRRLTVFG